jgi:hypothetical protein
MCGISFAATGYGEFVPGGRSGGLDNKTMAPGNSLDEATFQTFVLIVQSRLRTSVTSPFG